MGEPSYYREIGPALIQEIVEDLDSCRHIAMIGPRRIGKALVLQDIRTHIQCDQTKRWRVVYLAGTHKVTDTDREFLGGVANAFGVGVCDTPARDYRLAGAVTDIIRRATEQGATGHIVVLVETILGC